MEKQGNVIIKKVKKGGHGGHHGGSWKVAYADFVTAMMAFFLLMWLVTAKKMEDKAGIAEYFKEYNVSDSKGSIKKKIEKAKAKYVLSTKLQPSNNPIASLRLYADSELALKISSVLRDEIRNRLSEVEDQVSVDYADGAIKLQLADKDGNPMFQSGSSEMTPVAKKILSVIWDKIKDDDVKIAIEGHTDSAPYSSGGKTNWELSTDRASSARNELERLGLLPTRLIHVTGWADKKLLDKENPLSPKNRRITLLLYYFRNESLPAGMSSVAGADATKLDPNAKTPSTTPIPEPTSENKNNKPL